MEHAGNAPDSERVLDPLRLGVLAHEHGDVPRSDGSGLRLVIVSGQQRAAVEQARDVGRDEAGEAVLDRPAIESLALLLGTPERVVVTAADDHGRQSVAEALGGAGLRRDLGIVDEGLGEGPCEPPEERVEALDERWIRAVVHRQRVAAVTGVLLRPAVGEDVCPSEAIDGLLRVTDEEEPAGVLEDPLEDPVLDWIRVLELVDEGGLVAAPDGGNESLGLRSLGAERRVELQEQIVEGPGPARRLALREDLEEVFTELQEQLDQVPVQGARLAVPAVPEQLDGVEQGVLRQGDVSRDRLLAQLSQLPGW